MPGAIDWSNLTVAAAFLVGAALGSVATIRIMRHLMEYLRKERKPDDN